MKRIIKILTIAIVLLAFVFSLASLFFLFRGKPFIINKLEDLTQKKVTLSHCGLKLPFTLEINDLNIEGLFKAGYISISPSLLGFLTGKLAFNEIKLINPEVIYEKISAGPADTSAVDALGQIKPRIKKFLQLIVKRVSIKNGRLSFTDNAVGENGLKITVKDIDFKLNNAYLFPRSLISNFELKGNIPWQEGSEEGRIYMEGWLNPLKRDTQATLKIEGIDGVYLHPYYATWVDLEKARIEKAKLNFISNIHGLNNNVIAECRLELTDIVRKPRPPEESEKKAERITNAVLDVFRALNQGKIVLDFTIRTKMDQPVFGFGNIRMAFEDKLTKARKSDKLKPEDIVGFPLKLLEGTVKGATDLTRAVIDGMTAVGSELKKTTEATFKK